MASFKYDNVYLNDGFTIAGPYEVKGKLSNFDMSLDDMYFGEKTFEKAEVKMQVKAIDSLMARNYLNDNHVDCLIGGDLSNQITTSSVTAAKYRIPFLGVYAACASFNEALILGANLIKLDFKNIVCVTSSHNLNSEKQFRYPVEYGAPKKECTTFTATGSVAALVSNKESKVKIESATIGKVVDYGIKDANNMGAVMAPAAFQVLFDHLNEMKRSGTYYDLIMTGDLGEIGEELFKKLCQRQGIKFNKYFDAGTQIYKSEQDTKAGASGPIALPLVLFSKILPENKYKKILIIATGSLHSPALVNQKNSIPSIAQAVSLEVLQ